MDNIASLPATVRTIVDGVATGYLMAYSLLSPEGGRTFTVLLATWLLGTAFTAAVLFVAAFIWYAVFVSVRRCGRRLLIRGTKGLNLRRKQQLVNQFVCLDRKALILQGLSGVRISYVRSVPEKSFTKAVRGSCLARTLIQFPMIVGMGVGFLRYVLTTVWGIFTVAATWWAAGLPGLAEVADRGRQWLGSGEMQMTPASLSVAGVLLATLTFLLSRLRSAQAVGQHQWLRDEAKQATSELADREIAIGELLHRIENAQWELHSNLESGLYDFDEMAKSALADHDRELRKLLRLPPVGGGEKFLWRPSLGRGHSPRDLVVEEVASALEQFRDYLKNIDERTETRVRRSAPWKVVRLASRLNLRFAALSHIDVYVRAMQTPVVRLDPPLWYARKFVADITGASFPGAYPGEFEPSQIPEEARLAILADANSQWQETIVKVRKGHEQNAHEILINGLIGIAELRAARKAIFVYVHPIGPVSKLQERLWST